jgi:rhodanese-related sulfurtransferase
MKSGLVLIVLAAALAGTFFLSRGLSADQEPRADEAAMTRLLADPTQPWHKGHQVPLPAVVKMAYTASEAMGAFAEPPVKFPVMPVDLAWHLAKGSRSVPKGHPFAGRPVVLFDMRLKSLHMLEHIPGSSQAPWMDLPAALKKGEFKDMPRNTIVILYGEGYPHYDAPHAFRMAEFDAVYCLEGGLKRWKERGFPVESNATAVAFAKQQEAERPAQLDPSHGHPDPENIGPAALQLAMDQGMKPTIVFVGDRATYESGRIPGAIHVTFEEIPKRFETGDRDRLMLIYCGCCAGTSKGLSGMALAVLKKMGYRRLLHLEGHFKAWKEHGYPLEEGSPVPGTDR